MKKTKISKEPKEYTMTDLIEAMDNGKKEIYTILHYILNKNSHPLPQGVDFVTMFDELQDLEEYLMDLN